MSIPLELVTEDLIEALYRKGFTNSSPEAAMEILYGQGAVPQGLVARLIELVGVD